ncbi:MAG: ABC transporter ATP-binding protein [Actinobacteria bacterium]|nr:ABC transporter ATP-binding protein [Actinomycetota bacterium]
MASTLDNVSRTREQPANGSRSTGEPLLSVEHVRLGYWTPAGFNLAVGDVSFEVQRRERIIVIGPSGCGKSTLLKAIAGFISPAGGEISVAGRTAPPPGPDRAVVFQEFDQLFAWRTVLDNVAYPLRVNRRRRADATASARQFLELTGLGHAADRYPHQLSGGMKQRVAIARALALEPAILLMDEPFGSLDALTRARLQGELNAILDRTHTTLLFVTHSIDEALVLGDRVVVLGNAPSTVQELVDVRDVGAPDSAAYADMRRRLRRLLANKGEEVDENAVFV